MTGDEHYEASEHWLNAATETDLPYERAVVYANVAQTHALLAQIAAARELGVIQQAGIDAFAAANAPQTDDGVALPVRRDGGDASAAASSSIRFCTFTPNCRMADGHAGGCCP